MAYMHLYLDPNLTDPVCVKFYKGCKVRAQCDSFVHEHPVVPGLVVVFELKKEY